jgi:uncharacterized BrkB/YihY/UPF0761 family membrane protein
MNRLQSYVQKFDHYQKHSHYLGFSVAVVKKYNEDEAGRHAALLTYYLFSSIFPISRSRFSFTDDCDKRYY